MNWHIKKQTYVNYFYPSSLDICGEMVRVGWNSLPNLNALPYLAKALLNPKKVCKIGHSWALNSEQGILSSGNVEYKLDQQIQEGDIIVRQL